MELKSPAIIDLSEGQSPEQQFSAWTSLSSREGYVYSDSSSAVKSSVASEDITLAEVPIAVIAHPQEDCPEAEPKQPAPLQLLSMLTRAEVSETEALYDEIKRATPIELPVKLQRLKALIEKPITDSITIGKIVGYCLRTN